MRILIAEDEPDISLTYRISLEARHHSIYIVDNGDDCLRAYSDEIDKSKKKKRRQPFDVVILDYKLPRKNGLEVAKEILNWNPNQRIIFASAYVVEALLDSVKELKQVVELIQKPFEVNVLVEIIEDLEIHDSVKELSLKVRKIKNIDKPTPKEIGELLRAVNMAHKGKTFHVI